MTASVNHLPRTFVWRRLHSLTGLWLVLFLIEHLLVNSQAALWVGESGREFIELVNSIHHLPYVRVLEIVLIGVPILIHMVWGIKYLLTAKFNSLPSNGKTPSLHYARNHAYTWQRITSWILVVLLTFHIVKFRFLEYPIEIPMGVESQYLVKVRVDPGLYTVADRMHAQLYDCEDVEKLEKELGSRQGEQALIDASREIQKDSTAYEQLVRQLGFILTSAQNWQLRKNFIKKMAEISLKENEVIAVASNFGTASLLTVRDTFKSPFYVGLYTIFVLSACFHAFNGFWTFLITWGWILKLSSQNKMIKISYAVMLVIAFLGLAAVWGTYWVNLKT